MEELTIDEAIENKQKELEKIENSFNDLWNSFHEVKSNQKSSLRLYRYSKIYSLTNMLLARLKRDDTLIEAAECDNTGLKTAINKLQREKELFDMIELRICQLQLHEIDEFNEYIQVLLAMIQLRNDIIHKELCEMINTSTMQVKQINYFSGKDYHEELKSIEESITSSVKILGLVPNKKS